MNPRHANSGAVIRAALAAALVVILCGIAFADSSYTGPAVPSNSNQITNQSIVRRGIDWRNADRRESDHPWRLGLQLGGNASVPSTENSPDLNGGLGLDIGLLFAVSPQVALGFSIGNLGFNRDRYVRSDMPPPNTSLVSSSYDIKMYRTAATVTFFKSIGPPRRSRVLFDLSAGISAISQKVETYQRYYNSDLDQYYTEQKNVDAGNFGPTFGLGFIGMMTESFGIEMRGTVDFPSGRHDLLNPSADMNSIYGLRFGMVYLH